MLVSLVLALFLTPYALPRAVGEVSVEQVARGLEAPWSMAFASDGSIYLTERPGRIRIIKEGVLQDQPVATINVATFSGGEAGLLGLELDPGFESNKLLYIYYTYTDPQGRAWNKVSTLTESGGQFGSERVLLDGIAGASLHDGGRLKMGPDRKLYITTGDALSQQQAQNTTSLNGKILRINPNGSIPIDNPFPGSPVYSYGHRNPQGLAWDSAGHLLASEHGQSANDEINVIEKGRNYGWPTVQGVGGYPRFTDPVVSSGSETWAPSGEAFYSASNITEWTGKLLVATLRGQHLRVLDLNFSPSPHLISSTPFLSGTYGRLRDVVQGPDGFVYLATSNRDGRATPNQGDDKILRITGTSGLPSGPAEPPAYPLYVALAAVAGTATGLSFLAVKWLQGRRKSTQQNSAQNSQVIKGEACTAMKVSSLHLSLRLRSKASS